MSYINNMNEQEEEEAMQFRIVELEEDLDTICRQIIDILDIKANKGCRDTIGWQDFQNGDGEDVGIEIQALINKAKTFIE